MSDLRSELEHVINKYSREGLSNTPDFILGAYIVDALQAYERAVNQRDEWYGMNPEPGKTDAD